MKSNRVNQFGEDVCTAYSIIAKYKWHKGYACGSCCCKEYFEGKKPFSRRCSQCKRDESPTAGTTFDRLRMPLPAAIDIVKTVMKSKNRFTVEELCSYINSIGHRVNPKAAWELTLKIFKRMGNEPLRLKGDTLAVSILTKDKIYTVAKEHKSKKPHYLCFHSRNESHLKRELEKLGNEVKSLEDFRIKYINSERLKIWSPSKSDNTQPALELANDFWQWIANARKVNQRTIDEYIAAYLYKRNGGTYEDLMQRLVTRQNGINIDTK